MKTIKAVLFEPVGCLAEFEPAEFTDIAARVFGVPDAASETGSEAYWYLLDLFEQSGRTLTDAEAALAVGLELQAVEKAQCYEDVVPALAELSSMDVTLLVASSLSAPAVGRFLEKFSLAGRFSGVWTRENAGGVKAAPLLKAIEGAALSPEHVMVLVDTTDSLSLVKELGANAMLMINDYEQGRRLSAEAPAGGIVSLHELPAALRFVAEGARLRR